MLLGLRSAIYLVPDLAKARKWYAEVLGKAPYYDRPEYVGFDAGGFELGLFPAKNYTPESGDEPADNKSGGDGVDGAAGGTIGIPFGRFVGGGLHIGNRLFGGFGISGGASSAGAFDDGAIAGA